MRQSILAILAALVLGAGLASPARVSPQAIIVNPAPYTDLGVRVWVDKDAAGRGTASYRVNDLIRVGVSVTRDAYVYLFNVNADGEITLILPNGFSGGENRLYAGERRTFPAAGGGYRFRVDGPAGTDRVLALAVSEPLDTSALYEAESEGFYGVLVRGQDRLARTLSTAVSGLSARSWVTDVVPYRVRF